MTMNDELKGQALTAWHEQLTESHCRMSAQEAYVELVRLADNFRAKGIIGYEERKTLIEIATISYARSAQAFNEE
jgi:hypothetical protein